MEHWVGLGVPVGEDLPDLDGLGARERIELLGRLEVWAERVQGLQVRVLAALAADGLGDEVAAEVWESDRFGFLAEAVGCALRVGQDTAAGRLHLAQRLASRFPRTLGLLEAGRIHLTQARAVVEITDALEDATAAQVEAAVLGRMPEQTCGATRKALRRAVLRCDPEGARARHERARRERHVTHRMDVDGMAWWSAYLPAQDAARLDAAVDTHARATATAGDTRTLPQRRADALVELVAGHAVCSAPEPVRENRTGSGGGSGPLVQITIGYDTLIGTDDEPAELKGYGPVTAGQARALATAPGSIWRRLLVEPKDGRLVKADPTTYRPTADVTRHVTARDPHCQFPTCSMPAHRCDLDHVRPFDHQRPGAGGQTVPENLMPLCRRHHRLKHTPGWRTHRDPGTGRVTWTTPTGHTHTTDPHHYPTHTTTAGKPQANTCPTQPDTTTPEPPPF